MQIPENQYLNRKNLDTPKNNIEIPVSNPNDAKTNRELQLQLSMRSLAAINIPKVKQNKTESSADTAKTNNEKIKYRISSQLSNGDINYLSALGEVHNKSLIESGGEEQIAKAFSEEGEYSPKTRGLSLRESSDDTKPSSGLRYGVYDNGDEIILAVDGLQRGNKKDTKQMYYYMAENTKFPGKKFFADRAEANQLEELDAIYEHLVEQAKCEGKKLTVAGYSLGGAMVKSVASKYSDDSSTKFVTFNAFATENINGLTAKDLPNVKSYYITGDKLSNARGFFTGKLFVGPKQGGIPTSIDDKHSLEAFLFYEDTLSKGRKVALNPSIAFS